MWVCRLGVTDGSCYGISVPAKHLSGRKILAARSAATQDPVTRYGSMSSSDERRRCSTQTMCTPCVGTAKPLGAPLSAKVGASV